MDRKLVGYYRAKLSKREIALESVTEEYCNF